MTYCCIHVGEKAVQSHILIPQLSICSTLNQHKHSEPQFLQQQNGDNNEADCGLS